ncbi:MAG: SDR family oxidoreductase [Chloroflexi bacterium]|nr:SDR family oxidoreductase [Chloroflexota bacterium]
MNCLVTGGAGFIGSHLCDRLLDAGHRVICLDNLCTGARENVAHLIEHERFVFLERDVSYPERYREDVRERLDFVFHLASPASPVGYLKMPIETALANSAGTWATLEVAHEHGARYLLASTSEVYGEPLEHPQRETYWGNVHPNGLRSCNDESKRFAEALSVSYRRHRGTEVRIVRIFNTYGPRSDPDDGRVVPNFVTQALRGEPITVYGDGTQTRSLCFVSDMVEGILRAAFTPGTAGDVFNLGNPNEYTVLEYAQLIKKLSGSSAPVVFRPFLSEDDPSRRRPDITKARAVLGWQPSVPLVEGLEETLRWFRTRLRLGA